MSIKTLVVNTHTNNSYTMVIARTIDIMFCGWIWRNYDITISSMCGLELRKGAAAKRWAKILGGFLNKCEAGHCELAILADIARLQEAGITLGATL